MEKTTKKLLIKKYKKGGKKTIFDGSVDGNVCYMIINNKQTNKNETGLQQLHLSDRSLL